MYTYKIIDATGLVVTSAEDKHEIDAAWEVLLKTDEELQKTYSESSYLKQLIDRHRKPYTGFIELVQVWKTSDWSGLVGRAFDEVAPAIQKPFFICASRVDDVPMMWTSDFNPNRIGVEVVDGIITKVNGGG